MWARSHISPRYTYAHWRKVHGLGLVSALAASAVASLWIRPVPIFLFTALFPTPMVFNSLFHQDWFGSIMENGFCPAEDSDLFGFHTLTEPRLQPLGQAGDLVGDQAERSHSGYSAGVEIAERLRESLDGEGCLVRGQELCENGRH